MGAGGAGWTRATLAQLRSFLVVADCDTITEAADLLGVAQPTLSAQIKTLEAALGTALLDRGSTGTTLTTAGRRLRDDVTEPLARLGVALRAGDSSTAPSLRVAVCAGVPPEVLDRAVEALRPKASGVGGVRWTDAASSTHRTLLGAGRVDATLGREPGPGSRRIGHEPLGALVGEASPLARRELVDHATLGGLRVAWFDEARAPEYAARVRAHLRDRGCEPTWEPHPTRSSVLNAALRDDPTLVALRPRTTGAGLVWRPLVDPPHDDFWLTT